MIVAPALLDSTLIVDGRAAFLTMNRDDVRNELTGTFLADDIVRTVEWVNANEAISVLVLTGAGKSFSSGGNIKHMRDREGAFGGDVYAVQNRYRRGIQRVALAMHSAEVPTIAAVNGHAIGAGFDLAAMCDIRIAADTAKFGSTFVNLGIIPGDGGAWFLQRLIGQQKASELIFTGRVIDAAKALDMQLILKVVPLAELQTTVSDLAREIAGKPPQALRMAKRALAASTRLDLSDFLDMCAVFQGICHNTEEHVEAVASFLEKRSPRFKGHAAAP